MSADPVDPRIDELSPTPRAALTYDDVLALYGKPGAAHGATWLRMNFVSTLDGSATGPDGVSGTLSSETDKRIFGMLRRLADAVLVGAGTYRIEGYAPPLVSERQRTWRVEHGLAPEPELVILTREVDLSTLRADLAARGLHDLLCEGGPTVFGALLEVDAVDELCLTIAPKLMGGGGPRIAHSAHSVPHDLELAHVLRSATGDLHLRYTRA